MKCPFRKITVHTPAQPSDNLHPNVIINGRDEEMFADCYEKDCPYYRDFFGNEKRCLKVVDKGKQNE